MKDLTTKIQNLTNIREKKEKKEKWITNLNGILNAKNYHIKDNPQP